MAKKTKEQIEACVSVIRNQCKRLGFSDEKTTECVSEMIMAMAQELLNEQCDTLFDEYSIDDFVEAYKYNKSISNQGQQTQGETLPHGTEQRKSFFRKSKSQAVN